MNLFTVIVSFYKHITKKNIYIFFKSIERQTLYPKEIVIIIDGPIDILLKELIDQKIQRLKSFYDISIIKFIFDKNMGSAIAYNKAVMLSNTNFIIRCDADDFNYKERFEKVYSKLKKGYSLCGSSMIEFINGKKTFNTKPNNYSSIKKYSRYRNPFNNPTVGFKKSNFIELGGYQNIRYKEDYLLWIKWISKYKDISQINDFLVTTNKNSDFIKRRRGWINFYSEFYVFYFILVYKINTPFKAIIVYFTRCFSLLLPRFLLKIIYLSFLR